MIKKLKDDYENPRIDCDEKPVYMQVAKIRKSSLKSFIRFLEPYTEVDKKCWYHDYGTTHSTTCIELGLLCEGLNLNLPLEIEGHRIGLTDCFCKDCVIRLFITENPLDALVGLSKTRLPGLMSRPNRSFTRRSSSISESKLL